MGGNDGLAGRPSAKPGTTRSASDGERDVGQALRTVYQKTVEEKVPAEFMDLLGKLG